jgi:hypothetical protein
MYPENDALVIAATVRQLTVLFVVAGSAIVSVLANASVVHGIRGIIAYLHVILNQGASASAVWHDELVASRLEDQLPWVSLLRMLTLCGCACIGVAMVRMAAVASGAARR